MHVTLDGGQQHAALARGTAPALFFFDERNEVGDGELHHPCRFDHLRQEHPARAKEVADLVHAVHQRAFDDGQRGFACSSQRCPAFFGIADDKLVDALDERVGQSFANRQFAPGKIRGAAPGLAVFLDALGKFDQRLGSLRRTVQDHRLDLLAQLRLQIVVDADHPGVDDAHREPRLHRVVEENGVDRLAHGVVPPEAERDVGNPAGNLCVGQMGANPAAGLDEIDGVVVVFLDAGGHGKDVGVEDDVFCRETDAFQQAVGALADGDLARIAVGLPLLVKGHDDDGRAVAAGEAGALQESGFALLHRNRIDDALPLNAGEPRFDDLPFRRVDHDRHPRDVRFGGDQFQKAFHGGEAVEQRVIHVDVDHLRAIFDLLAGHGQRVIKTSFANHPGKGFRAGDVGALADIDEQRFRADVERLQAGEAQFPVDLRHFAR